ncbi:uncharacterized protein N7477_008781 [Penicillium maclennaniae]|uniref:uncharacterized protein n=1 Tax=Penicillium maclennaniae TaxID=1343394 RepID=UPI002540E2DA|nr:uncharacterized protein N7477_008781 [Penicillium maclennaniae]KAJ5666333.1 hypothetical protein N7477_008781 [Penicillium maclennaniae]
MEFFAEAGVPAVAVASAISVAAGAYLNAKLSISTDLSTIFNDRAFGKRLAERIGQLGESATIYKLLEQVVEVEGQGATDAVWFEQKTWSYTQLKELADRFAALLHSRGVKSGDMVGVYTTNSPEMVIVLYALSKLGAVAAMINTNLRDDTFVHCLDVSGSKSIISTPDVCQHVCADLPHSTFNLSSFDGTETGATDLITFDTLQQFSPNYRKTKSMRRTKYVGFDHFHTAVIRREQQVEILPHANIFISSLFHGTAFFTGCCYSVGNAGTLCLRRKFSASQFWKDVHDSRATRILYIGELCRYLVATPPSPYDRNHNCIVASGNGLRGEIWERFRQRFNVPEVREFYRSTEGLAKFDNHGVGAWGVGKVGFSGPIRRLLEDDTFIVKYDTETEMPYRDPKTGFCIRASLGEEGEAIGRVRDRGLLTEYLHNEEATESKLLRDVFEKGDVFQRTGDLVLQDHSGWIGFRDRVGDTFRWKGENVSAGEIRDHICRIEGVHDAVVYGVKLSSYDGQAGAAGITLEEHSPAAELRLMSNLYKELKKRGVPSYALPRLVRITEKVATGVTFKQAKGDLVKKSWDPRKGGEGDSMYWLDGTTYQRLDDQGWTQIETGAAKL